MSAIGFRQDSQDWMTGNPVNLVNPVKERMGGSTRTNWVKRRLGNAVQVNPKANPLPEEFVYIDLESVKDGELQQRKVISRIDAPSRAQRTLRTGDVLFQLVRPYQQNNLFFEPQDGADYVASTGYGQIRTEQEPRYFYYSFHRTEFLNRILALCTGTGYPAIAPSELSKIVICYPSSTDEQRRIAEILSTCDEVITRSRAVVEKLRKIKAGMLNDFFTRGIGTDGQLRPAPDERTGLTGFTGLGERPAAADAENAKSAKGRKGENPVNPVNPVYKPSPLGPIPTAWAVKRLGDVCDTSSGGTPSRSVPAYYRGTIKWFTTSELKDCDLFDSDEHISEDALKNSSAKLFCPGTILMAMYGATIGKLGVLRVEAASNQACCAISCKQISPAFLYYQLLHLRTVIIDKGCGAGQSNISQEIVGNLEIVCPTPTEQDRIAERLAAMDERIVAEERVIVKYRSVKAGLMQRLLAPPSDAEVEEVM